MGQFLFYDIERLEMIYPAVMSTTTANPIAKGANLLLLSSTAVIKTVKTKTKVNMPSAITAQPGSTPGPSVCAPPFTCVSLYTASGRTA